MKWQILQGVGMNHANDTEKKPIIGTDLIDVFKEAANVIAGNIVTRLALDGSITLDVAVAERLQYCSEPRTSPRVLFNVDDGFCSVAVVSSNG